jgi:hypothetical protein
MCLFVFCIYIIILIILFILNKTLCENQWYLLYCSSKHFSEISYFLIYWSFFWEEGFEIRTHVSQDVLEFTMRLQVTLIFELCFLYFLISIITVTTSVSVTSLLLNNKNLHMWLMYFYHLYYYWDITTHMSLLWLFSEIKQKKYKSAIF